MNNSWNQISIYSFSWKSFHYVKVSFQFKAIYIYIPRKIENLQWRVEDESSKKQIESSKNEIENWDWDEIFPWESRFRDRDYSLAEVW